MYAFPRSLCSREFQRRSAGMGSVYTQQPHAGWPESGSQTSQCSQQASHGRSPIRQDLLLQTGGLIHHPQLELWKLWVWVCPSPTPPPPLGTRWLLLVAILSLDWRSDTLTRALLAYEIGKSLPSFFFFFFLNENYRLQVILSFTAEIATSELEGLDAGTCALRRL